MNNTLQYVIITTEINGNDRRDNWQPQWGKPTAKKMRELVAKRSAPVKRVRVVEANAALAEPATVVDLTF